MTALGVGRGLGLALLVGLLAACGSGSSHPSTATRSSAPSASASVSGAPSSASPSASSPRSPEATAAHIVTTLAAHGFAVGATTRNPDWVYDGISVDTTIDGDGAHINAFASAKDAHGWVELSLGFGGIAVVGDTWAISLTCATDPSKCGQSRVLAHKIADALDATVKDGSTG